MHKIYLWKIIIYLVMGTIIHIRTLCIIPILQDTRNWSIYSEGSNKSQLGIHCQWYYWKNECKVKLGTPTSQAWKCETK